MAVMISPAVLEKLFTEPVTVYPKSTTNSLGDIIESPPMVFYGYVFEEMKKVVTFTGDEIISGTQIYLKGEDIDQIEIHSKVSCQRAVKQPILTRELFRGEQNKPFIGILYLP